MDKNKLKIPLSLPGNMLQQRKEFTTGKGTRHSSFFRPKREDGRTSFSTWRNRDRPSERATDRATVRRHAEYGGQTPLTKSGNSRPERRRRGCEDSTRGVPQPGSSSAASAAFCMPAKCLNAITASAVATATARGRVELS